MRLTEEQIRPESLRAGKERALRSDLRWLRAHRQDFVDVCCPACRSRKRRPAFGKYGFAFAECLVCRTVYMTPRPTRSLLEEFYAASSLYAYWDRHVFPASRAVRRARIMRPRARRIVALCRRHGIPTATFVDIGAAGGLLCEEIRETGAFERVIAVEPNREQAASCRRAGFETVEAAGERVRLRGKISALAACEVLEHLFSPEALLKRCRELLVPGGLMVVTCPNYHGFDIQTLGVKSESLDAEHINLFNPVSLPRLFERCGFRVLECRTPGQLDAEIVRTQTLAGVCSLDRQPFLRRVLLDDWEHLGQRFQRFLSRNRLSSHLWLAATTAPGGAKKA